MLPLALCVVAQPTLAEGPFSKFDRKPPAAEYASPRKLEDIERCLIDMDGFIAPIVYRQPDRPDDVTLMWRGGSFAIALARIDLHRESGGTRIRSWLEARQVQDCAPQS